MKGERPFRENVTLPFDTNLLKRFGTVEDLLANQRWNESIAILQEIAQTESQSLVLVQPGKAGGVATYLNANNRCNVLLSRIPAEGRLIYRQKFDAQAKRWFENWQRTRDQTELLKIVRQTYLSSHSDDALVALGEVAWDAGDFALARQWWEQLIPLPNEADPAKYPTVLRYPDSQVDRPTTLARILSCSILERDWNRAADELQQFNQQYPAAEGWLAGQKGCLADILRKTLDDAKQWKAPRSGSQFSTFAASPEREFRSSETLDAGAEMWVRPLPANTISHRLGRFPLPIDPLCYFPVTFESTFDRIVLVNDANSIRAWNLLNGEPAWPSEGKDPAAI